MTEIKFRVWDKERLIMYNDAFNILDPFNVNVGLSQVNDMIWMQFTGLLDSTGKPIYHGDVLKTINGINAFVDYINGCFLLHGDPGRQLLCRSCSEEEVIGNIYENPGFLNRIF